MGRVIEFEPELPDWEKELKLDDIIVSHIIHSWVQLRDKQELLEYRPGMTVTQLHKANYAWLHGMIEKFEAKRRYRMKADAVTEGLYWFLMGYKKK